MKNFRYLLAGADWNVVDTTQEKKIDRSTFLKEYLHGLTTRISLNEIILKFERDLFWKETYRLTS